MTGFILFFLLLTLAPSCWHLRRMLLSLPIDPATLASGLESECMVVTPAALARAMCEYLPDWHPQRELAAALADGDPDRRTAACNEALHELDGVFRRRAALASGSRRLGLFSFSLLILGSFLRSEHLGWEHLDVALSALVGWVLLSVLTGEINRLMRQQRTAIDRWVAISLTRTNRRAVSRAS